jgi:hypothetical protein
MGHFLEETGISIIAATIMGLLTYRPKQPVISGYFLAGAIIGCAWGLKLVTSSADIQVISGIGLILPLFKIETSAKILPEPKSSSNQSIYCRAGALTCKIQPGAAVLRDFCRSLSFNDPGSIFPKLRYT